MKILILIILLLIACYLILYKNVIKILENFIFENIIFIHIFIEHGFLFFLFFLFMLFILYIMVGLTKFFILMPYLFFNNWNSTSEDNQKLTEWEIEFQKEKEKEKEKEELERIKEEKAFKKNRSERRKRRKVRYETVEYPGEKYHPDFDGVYFFYERFQDAIWRTKGMKSFRSKFKICFPYFLFFIFVFTVWLIDCLSSLDFFIYNTNSVYVKIDNQFVYLSRELFSKKGTKFLTVVDWDTQLVNRYKIFKNGKFEKQENFFITDLHYNWMFQKDIRSKKFPFRFYNWIFYKDNIMIFEEKKVKYENILNINHKKRSFFKIRRRGFNRYYHILNEHRRYFYSIDDERPKIKKRAFNVIRHKR